MAKLDAPPTPKATLVCFWLSHYFLPKLFEVKTQWRKCMGIEPTGHMISMRPDGFEDRGQHQLNKHFRN